MRSFKVMHGMYKFCGNPIEVGFNTISAQKMENGIQN
jgi:hypothetical protein